LIVKKEDPVRPRKPCKDCLPNRGTCQEPFKLILFEELQDISIWNPSAYLESPELVEDGVSVEQGSSKDQGLS